MSDGLTLAAVGDIAFNGGYDEIAGTERANSIFANVREQLQADLLIGNLEAVLIADRPRNPPWRFCMRGAPAFAEILARSGFKVLSLAGNHTMDYGWDAVAETVAACTRVGILTPGVGKNETEARQPALLKIKGKKVAVLSYCSIHVGIHLYATADKPGVAPGREEAVVEDVRKAKVENDIVIVCLHWGDEYVRYPKPAQRDLAKKALEAGADAVLGHHPHVLQGMERAGNGFIAYSLGNFVFANEIWKGVSKEGNAFSWPFVLIEDARRTTILRATFEAGAPPRLEWRGAHLHEDLTVRPDRDAEPAIKKLSRWFGSGSLYPIYWAVRFFPTRLYTQYRQNYRSRDFRKIRPRHLKDLWKTLVHELQQFRGAKS